jgi:uncharacterized YceG family protein
VSDRSPEEREAARLERERRRAGREGNAPPDPASEPPAARFDTGPGRDPEPDPDTTREPAPDSRPGPSSNPGSNSNSSPGPSRSPAPPAAFFDEFDEDDHETPSGTRRVFRSPSPAAVAEPGELAEPAADRASRTPRRPGSFRRRSLAGRLLATLALGVAGVAVWFLVSLFQPFHARAHGSVTVTIPKNVSGSKVADLLERDGVVSSAFFFNLRAILAGKRGDLHAGTFKLQKDMSYGAALDVLTAPPKPVQTTDITITEGKTRQQIDALLRRQGISGSYLAATRRSQLLDPRSYGAPRGTPTLEGFLFPSTYQLRDPISVGSLVADQLRTFREQFALVNLSAARRAHVSPYAVLTIASMVEAEAQTAHDRPLVASVIYNRLRLGMPLGIDATTRYATGNYTRPLTVSQLGSTSPYNTRLHKGLPPTPIDNPGLESIQAAANPAHTNFLYFVVKPCGNGGHAFSSTDAQFQADVQRYQTARAKRGGKSPTHC